MKGVTLEAGTWVHPSGEPRIVWTPAEEPGMWRADLYRYAHNGEVLKSVLMPEAEAEDRLGNYRVEGWEPQNPLDVPDPDQEVPKALWWLVIAMAVGIVVWVVLAAG